jgi:cyclophilin family peptidyl-prolyl cis-trans isomerase
MEQFKQAPKLKLHTVTNSNNSLLNIKPNKKIKNTNFSRNNKNINKIDSIDDYQLTEGAMNQLDNVFDEYILSKKRTHIYFDISINNENIGKINIELFDDIVPNTVRSFVYMINNHYKGSNFHRIIKDFVIQGGDYINGDGTGSNSIYGEKFDDENFDIKHDSKYLLSMANSGPNTNGCQFFITLRDLHELDNKHVVFGKIIGEESQMVVDKLSEVYTNKDDKPINNCCISDCGIITD